MTLGNKLKQLRDLSGLTLRQIEEATGVSNAYLSQLENDKIKKPSAQFLYKLSSIYRVDICELLYAAGLIKEDQFKIETGFIKHINAGEITPEEEKSLIEYLQFLRYKKKMPNE